MLASPAASVADALAGTGLASVEWKLDGARIQAHRAATTFASTPATSTTSPTSRRVVEVVRALPGGDLVLDGEVLGVDDDRHARRFQDTMGDFGADADRRRQGRCPLARVLLRRPPRSTARDLVDEPLAVAPRDPRRHRAGAQPDRLDRDRRRGRGRTVPRPRRSPPVTKA